MAHNGWHLPSQADRIGTHAFTMSVPASNKSERARIMRSTSELQRARAPPNRSRASGAQAPPCAGDRGALWPPAAIVGASSTRAH